MKATTAIKKHGVSRTIMDLENALYSEAMDNRRLGSFRDRRLADRQNELAAAVRELRKQYESDLMELANEPAIA